MKPRVEKFHGIEQSMSGTFLIGRIALMKVVQKIPKVLFCFLRIGRHQVQNYYNINH